MHAVSQYDDDEPYEGPYAGDQEHLSASDETAGFFEDDGPPARGNYLRIHTLKEAVELAQAQDLEPFTGGSGRWIGLDCPVCKALGRKSAATIVDEGGGLLTPECPSCHNDVDPGILATLGRVPNNVVPLHRESASSTAPDATRISWVALDLVTLGDTPRVPPAIGGLIYPGRRHLFWGESESGKTWLAFGNAADELLAGRGVVWVDLDYMGAQDVLERLRQFGVPDDTIRERFVFYQPDGPLGGYSLDAVLALMAEKGARLVVFDAFTGLCALHGLNPNDGIDIEKAYRAIQPLCDTGAAAVILDHVVKNADNRGRYAQGSERKLSGADVALGFTLVEHYGRGRTGRARLIVHKDRPAQLKRPIVGVFALRSDPDTHQVSWSLDDDTQSTTDTGKLRPTGYMERVSRYLEPVRGPITRSAIVTGVGGKDVHVRTALDCLAAEGFTYEIPGGNRSIMVTLVRPFREDQE